jgi:hypothetical protein
MKGLVGLAAKGPDHCAWWLASGNLCPLCHPPGPAKLTTRKAGAEPALSGCRTLSASIPIPPPCRNLRRAAPGERRSHFAMHGRIERMSQSRSFLRRCPRRTANGPCRSERVHSLLTATPQQCPCRARFRHCQSATRPRMLRLQSTSPLYGAAIVAVLRFTRQRPSNVRSAFVGEPAFAIACFADIRPHACGSQGRALCRSDRPARRRAGNAAKAASARCRAQSHDRAARKCRRRPSRP